MSDNEINRIDPEQIPVEETVVPEASVPVEETASAEAPVPETVPESPVLSASAEKAKTFAKKPVAMIVAAVVVVVAIVAGVIAASAASPMALVGKGISNSVKALEKNDVLTLLADTKDGGSMELACELEDITTSLIGIGVDGQASVKLYSGVAEAALAGNLEMDGEAVFDMLMVLNEDALAVSSEVLLGTNAYGIDLKNLMENFETSEFGPDGEYSLGIEPEYLQSIIDNAEGSKKMAEDMEVLVEEIAQKLISILADHAEIDKGGDTLKFNGTEAKVTAVEVAADKEALAAICVEMIEYLRDNEKLRNFAYDNAENLLGLSGAYYYYSDGEEFIDEIYDDLDAMTEEKLAELAETIEDSEAELAVTFYITKSGKELVGVDVETGSYGETVSVSVLAGPTLEEPQEISIRYDDGYDKIRAAYTVEASDSKEYSARLKVREDSEVILSGKFDWDKKSGEFELELTDEWEDTYFVEGSIEATGKTATITVESVGDSYDEYDLGVSLILSTSDKMPAMPKYTDILKMDSGEIEDLIYDLVDAAGDLELGDLLYLFW